MDLLGRVRGHGVRKLSVECERKELWVSRTKRTKAWTEEDLKKRGKEDRGSGAYNVHHGA
jgi:hypothetical protein